MNDIPVKSLGDRVSGIPVGALVGKPGVLVGSRPRLGRSTGSLGRSTGTPETTMASREFELNAEVLVGVGNQEPDIIV